MLLGWALSPCLGHSESSSFSSTQPAQLTPVLLGKRGAPQRQPNEPLRPALWHGVRFPVPMQSQPQPVVSSCRAVWGWWVSPVRCRTPQLQRSSARLSSRQPPGHTAYRTSKSPPARPEQLRDWKYRFHLSAFPEGQRKGWLQQEAVLLRAYLCHRTPRAVPAPGWGSSAGTRLRGHAPG